MIVGYWDHGCPLTGVVRLTENVDSMLIRMNLKVVCLVKC